MKPYILNYSEIIDIKPHNPIAATDTTTYTFTVEVWDEDEITNAVNCSTLETKTIEPSDDEIANVSTEQTRTIEPADNDEILLMSTLQTNTLENSDNDEIHLN